MSNKNTLNTRDWQDWSKNLLVFAAPALIAGMLAWQINNDLSLAKGAFLAALVSSCIDLLRKYRAE